MARAMSPKSRGANSLARTAVTPMPTMNANPRPRPNHAAPARNCPRSSVAVGPVIGLPEFQLAETRGDAIPQALSDQVRDREDELAPIVAPRHGLTRRPSLFGRERRRERAGDRVRPVFRRTRDENDVLEVQQGPDRRADDGPAARQVFVELERVDVVRVPGDDVRHDADVEVLG